MRIPSRARLRKRKRGTRSASRDHPTASRVSEPESSLDSNGAPEASAQKDPVSSPAAGTEAGLAVAVPSSREVVGVSAEAGLALGTRPMVAPEGADPAEGAREWTRPYAPGVELTSRERALRPASGGPCRERATTCQESGRLASASQDRTVPRPRLYPEPHESWSGLEHLWRTRTLSSASESPASRVGSSEEDLPVLPLLAYNVHRILIAIGQEVSQQGQTWTLRLERLGGPPGSDGVWCRRGLLDSPEALAIGSWRPTGELEPASLDLTETMGRTSAEQAATRHHRRVHHLLSKAEVLDLLMEVEGPEVFPFFSTARGAFLVSRSAFQRCVDLAEARLGLPTHWLLREAALAARACQREGGEAPTKAGIVVPTVWVGRRGEEAVTRRHLEAYPAESAGAAPRPSWLSVSGPDEGRDVLENLRLAVLLMQAQKEVQRNEAATGRRDAVQAPQGAERPREPLPDAPAALDDQSVGADQRGRERHE